MRQQECPQFDSCGQLGAAGMSSGWILLRPSPYRSCWASLIRFQVSLSRGTTGRVVRLGTNGVGMVRTQWIYNGRGRHATRHSPPPWACLNISGLSSLLIARRPHRKDTRDSIGKPASLTMFVGPAATRYDTSRQISGADVLEMNMLYQAKKSCWQPMQVTWES